MHRCMHSDSRTVKHSIRACTHTTCPTELKQPNTSKKPCRQHLACNTALLVQTAKQSNTPNRHAYTQHAQRKSNSPNSHTLQTGPALLVHSPLYGQAIPCLACKPWKMTNPWYFLPSLWRRFCNMRILQCLAADNNG